MKNTKNVFPDLSRSYAGAMEEMPVVLDGQKVLFDKKVSLMPVELKKNEQKHRTST